MSIKNRLADVIYCDSLHLWVCSFVMSMFFGRLASYNQIIDLTSTRTEANDPTLGKDHHE